MKSSETWVLYEISSSEIIEVFLDKNKADELYDIKIKEDKNKYRINFLNLSDEQYDEHFNMYISHNIIIVITLKNAIDNIKERLTDYFESIINPNYN